MLYFSTISNSSGIFFLFTINYYYHSLFSLMGKRSGKIPQKKKEKKIVTIVNTCFNRRNSQAKQMSFILRRMSTRHSVYFCGDILSISK